MNTKIALNHQYLYEQREQTKIALNHRYSYEQQEHDGDRQQPIDLWLLSIEMDPATRVKHLQHDHGLRTSAAALPTKDARVTVTVQPLSVGPCTSAVYLQC